MSLRGVPSIEPAHAADRFFSGALSLVDVRSDHEHGTIRIPCATHIPLPQLRRRIDEIPTDRPVALVCRSGHRSALATLIAQRHRLGRDERDRRHARLAQRRAACRLARRLDACRGLD